MTASDLSFGLTLSNRGVALGGINAAELIELAEAAEACGRFDSVWAGDAFLSNPRLDSIGLLAAVAARTRRVLLAPACMGSFTQRGALDLAYAWASLDNIAGGRTLMVACVGGGSGTAWQAEGRNTGVPAAERHALMWERIDLLRRLWAEPAVSFRGRYHDFENVTVAPRPLRQPYPIWVASNAGRLSSGRPGDALPVGTLRRIGGTCDGWMTHSITPDGFSRAWQAIADAAIAAGRDAAALDNCLYQNVCIAESEEAAMAEAGAYLEAYYGIRFTADRLRQWGAYGPPALCAARLRAYAGSGVRRLALRLAAGDQTEQFRRLVEEVLPRM